MRSCIRRIIPGFAALGLKGESRFRGNDNGVCQKIMCSVNCNTCSDESDESDEFITGITLGLDIDGELF
jgi:hypothetical protein